MSFTAVCRKVSVLMLLLPFAKVRNFLIGSERHQFFSVYFYVFVIYMKVHINPGAVKLGFSVFRTSADCCYDDDNDVYQIKFIISNNLCPLMNQV